MDKFDRKKLVFIILVFALCFSFITDFCLKSNGFDFIHKLQTTIYWPSGILALIILIYKKNPFNFNFSKYSLILTLIIGLGVFLRIYKIDALPLNSDEANATLGGLWSVKSGEAVKYANLPICYFSGYIPSLFSFFVYLSSLLFKHLALIVRWPAAMIGGLTIWMAYLFTKDYYNRRSAAISAFLIAILPWHIILSRIGIRAVLTPLFGLIIFCLLHRAIKKKDRAYLFLSSLALSVGAFYTYTAAQIYIVIYISYLLSLRKYLKWVKPFDVFLCFVIFLFPLYPFLASWKSCNYLHNQYYSNIFGSYGPGGFSYFFQKIISNWKEALSLLFIKKNAFSLFAPGFEGPIIYLGLAPLFFISILHAIRDIKGSGRLMILWLVVGFFLSSSFLKTVEDRHIIIILPLIPILVSGLIGSRINFPGNFNVNNIAKNAYAAVAVALLALGILQSFTCFARYTSNIASSEIDLKRYSFGAESVAGFLNKELTKEGVNYKILTDCRMPVYYYLAYMRDDYGDHLSGSFIRLQYDAPLQEVAEYKDQIINGDNGIIYLCLWSPESRINDWDSKYCELYKAFKQLYPNHAPEKIIYYPNKKKAIEVFKLSKENIL